MDITFRLLTRRRTGIILGQIAHYLQRAAKRNGILNLAKDKVPVRREGEREGGRHCVRYFRLTELMKGMFRIIPITGILRKKLMATGKKPLKHAKKNHDGFAPSGFLLHMSRNYQFLPPT